MKTLIILRGWQSSKGKWQEVKENIESDEIEVIIPDLPGFKPETELEKPWNLDDYTEWLKDFSQDREKFFLLGHSFGGRVGIKFAVKYPQKLYGLVLVSAAGVKKEPRVSSKILGWGAKMVRTLKIEEMPETKGLWQIFRKLFYRYILRKTDYLEVSGFLKDTIKNILKEDLTPLLKEIKVPVLILWGEKDKITPLSDATLMKKEIKFSELQILKNIGHTPHLENPELLAQKVKEFLI
ncbi:alpha/beta hydrolase [Patescibacteria group bacterium]|nr:alpha/beta hydrolase [Patescibacteria group bacterium]